MELGRDRVMYSGMNAGVGGVVVPSPAIWEGCDWNPLTGYGDFDHFTKLALAGTLTTQIGLDRYKAFASAGGTIGDGGAVGGVVKLLTDNTDNDSIAIADAVLPYKISGIAGSKTGKLRFEGCIKLASIADASCEAFLGLVGAQTLAAAVPITATAATMADLNLVGFYRTESDGDAIAIVYKADGVNQVTVKAIAAVPVADEYIRLGFVFDPVTNTMTFYVNGQEVTGLTVPVVAAVLGATAGTDFPNDVTLGRCLAMRNAGGAINSVSMDWWGCHQEF